MLRIITRTIWILSLVSFFTDIASEMLYPVMPIYLKSIGFSVLLIGLLEGLAEATAGLSKGYFGKRADVTGKRTSFIRWGYACSAISKPMLALSQWPWWVFLSRTTDRLGKGMRTGARDAVLSAETTPENKGKVFGFHRSMDTLGAVLGPAGALVYLHFYPAHYRMLFLIAFLPGLVAVSATTLLRGKNAPRKGSAATPFFSFLRYWKQGPVAYKRAVRGFLVFSLFNSADVFLLLRIKQAGAGDTLVIAIYIFYNLVYALISLPAGIFGDRFGLKKVYVTGLVLFSAVYYFMGQTTNTYVFFALFLLYGGYAAMTEGISKAWLTNLVDPGDTATAIGTFTGLQSIAALIASSLTGLLWMEYSARAALTVTAVAALGVVAYFLWVPETPPAVKHPS